MISGIFEKENKKTIYEKEYYNLLKENYPDFAKILKLKNRRDFGELKRNFRAFLNIDGISRKQKILLNLSYEYFSLESRLNDYDPYNLKPIPFDIYLLVIIDEFINFHQENDENSQRNLIDKKGRSFLYLASRCGYINQVKYLLKLGVSPNIVQKVGSTPLHGASFYGHFDIVKLLLEVGVDANITNNFGNLAEDEAYSNEIKELIIKFKNERIYKFLNDKNNMFFEKYQLMFDGDELIGKRYTLKNVKFNLNWDLAWHGTLLNNIPGILKHGLKPAGMKVDGVEIEIRSDAIRKEKRNYFKQYENWSQAIFTSSSLFYAGSTAYAEHIKDFNGNDWIVVLEVRIKPNSFKSFRHTFYNYQYRINEPKNVENRSEDPNNVVVVGVVHLKKKFLRKENNYNIMMEKIKKYIIY